MNRSGSRSVFLAIIFAGVLYIVIGIGFGELARNASFNVARETWRRLAFVISAVVFAAQLVYETGRIGQSPAKSAWHVALAVALGGFGLAVAANLHSRGAGPDRQQRLLALSLLLWPLLAGIPAFVAGLAGAAGFQRWRGRRQRP